MSTALSPTSRQFIQADLAAFVPPVVSNYKSYGAYIKDFKEYIHFRNEIMTSLASAPQKKKQVRTPKIVVHAGREAAVTTSDGRNYRVKMPNEDSATLPQLRMEDPYITNATELPTEAQLAAKKARKRAKNARQKLARQRRKNKAAQVQLDGFKIQNRLSTLKNSIEIKAKAPVGVETPKLDKAIRRLQTDIPETRMPADAAASVRQPPPKQTQPPSHSIGEPPVRQKGGGQPWTPTDRSGNPISPNRTKISDPEWQRLLLEEGEAARNLRREYKEAYEKRMKVAGGSGRR